MRLEDLNALDADAATRELRRCCGSAHWAREMTAARPFASVDAMAAWADVIWAALDRVDWLEAFAAHPKIGESGGPGEAGRAGGWSEQEQRDVAGAAEITRRRLAEVNRDYESRFGYIFIVCATGKGADEMLRVLERRLKNDAAAELAVAAEEQRKITRLRLAKLVEEHVEGRQVTTS
ncbi:MAG: 2-oxo-4-hydroxy-4-carboxy-5-ureidoimidazoline decarboxylase [Acidobacteria bacterium]|nr:2-oxo-4-hydroxy-4-carboxy-5-ureidoimidazoline decarboxylase [Acidobacteriota bacterium]